MDSLRILKTVVSGDATPLTVVNENNITNYFTDDTEIELLEVMIKIYRRTHSSPTYALLQATFSQEVGSNEALALINKLKKSDRIKPYKPEEVKGFMTLQNQTVVRDRLKENLESLLDRLETESLSELEQSISDIKSEAISAEASILEDDNTERLLHVAVNAGDIFREKYEKRVKSGGKKVSDYGYSFIDETIGGIKSTDLISIVGSTKQFKSTLLRNIGYKGILQGKNILYVTIEMSYNEVEESFLCMHCNNRDRFPDGTRITYKEIGDGAVEDVDFMYEAYDDLISAEDLGIIYILKPSGMYEYDRFVADLTRVENSFVDVDMILVDSLNLMEGSGREDVNELIRKVRQLTLSKNNNLGIPVISPFQINRQGFKEACMREGNLYSTDAIREYAEVEMSSTIVMSTIQTDEMRNASVIQVQHLLSRETGLFKPTKLQIDAEIGVITELSANGSVDYTSDEVASEIVDIVSKDLF